MALGPDEGNSPQYTGRENDGTGLYYYRARYYDPVLKRFVSEDPIGISGGANLYQYVGGIPTVFNDPTGRIFFVPFIIAALATSGGAAATAATTTATIMAIGGVVGGLSGALAAGSSLGWCWQNAGAIARSAAIGAGVGVLAGSIGGGLGAAALVGGASGFAGNVLGQISSGTQLGNIDWRQAGFQGAIGVFAGFAAVPAFAPLVVPTAAVAAAGLSGAAILGGNAVTSTSLGGFGYANIVK